MPVVLVQPQRSRRPMTLGSLHSWGRDQWLVTTGVTIRAGIEIWNGAQERRLRQRLIRIQKSTDMVGHPGATCRPRLGKPCVVRRMQCGSVELCTTVWRQAFTP